MGTFTTAPVQEVLPKSVMKKRGTSNRAQVKELYKSELQKALDEGRALVVELGPEDKALTIKNRLQRAADALNMGTDVVIATIRRKKGDTETPTRITAYQRKAEEEVLADTAHATRASEEDAYAALHDDLEFI